MFAIKYRHSAPATRRLRPSRFGYIGPEVKGKQAEIRRILRSTGAQTKVTIGQPNDKYEQEADCVADKVMVMPDSKLQRQSANEEEEETLQTKPLAGQITPLIQRQEEPPEEEKELQAKSKTGEITAGTPNLESRINNLKGGGQPLDSSTRTFFEPRFGHDFSHVRVHTESSAADTAKSINARAFTLGNHVVMGSGEYHPNSRSGQRLLGHELTHVIQQSESRTKNKAQHRDSIKSKPMDMLGVDRLTRQPVASALHIQRQAGSSSPQCAMATRRAIFILYASGINTGNTYLRTGAMVELFNADTRLHRIRINPVGLFSNHSFTINPGGKVYLRVLSTSRVTGGSIIDRRGSGRRTYHDVMVCP